MNREHSVIVGGTRGSGKALARLLVAEGQTVSVIGRRKVAECDLSNSAISVYNADLTQAEDLPALFDRIEEERGPWSSLFFFQRYRSEGNLNEGEWQVSVRATTIIIDHCTRELGSTFEKPSRAIVVAGSVAARMDTCRQPVCYHACKAALEQMVRSYAVRLGPMGIRVNMVSPDLVLKDESADFYRAHDDLQELYRNIVPLQRMGTAEEVATVARFLSSSEASYITGQCLVMDGGLSLQMHESFARDLLRKYGWNKFC